jgi:N-acetylmuramate 1-kinase
MRASWWLDRSNRIEEYRHKNKSRYSLNSRVASLRNLSTFWTNYILQGMPTDTLLTAAKAHLNLEPLHKVTIEPIKKGASGRTIVRIKPEGHCTYIGIHYTLERADNANYLPVGKFLKKAKLNVPEVLYDNIARRCALVEDLGDNDLFSFKGRPWKEREPYYRSVFLQLDKLSFTRPPKDIDFQPPFNADLYRWEHGYFFEFFAGAYLGLSPAETEPLFQHQALQKMATQLGASARNLVHRDLQSQNILIHNNEAYLIDFQGMRYGRQEYDLASLIYDPYMDHSHEEKEKLLDLWEEITEERPIDDILKKCAIQRLLQALGAYGNILSKQGDQWYAQHIPTAVASLKELIAGTDLEEPLSKILNKA